MNEYEFFKALCNHGELQIDELANHDSVYYQLFLNLQKKGLKLQLQQNKLILEENIVPLDSETIVRNILAKGNEFKQKIHILYESSSTNTDIKKIKATKDAIILLAEYQSQGKGRRGNNWYSPVGQNIYLSLKFQEPNAENLSYLPLYIGALIAEALEELNFKGIKVKWPNDIYLGKAKLCGLILERVMVSKGVNSIILGIGINVNMDQETDRAIDKKVTSLKYHNANHYVDRNEILAALLPELINGINIFNRITFSQVKESWDKFNLLAGKELTISQENRLFHAKYLDIDEDGSLRVALNNKIVNIYAGDVSIKQWSDINCG